MSSRDTRGTMFYDPKEAERPPVRAFSEAST